MHDLPEPHYHVAEVETGPQIRVGHDARIFNYRSAVHFSVMFHRGRAGEDCGGTNLCPRSYVAGSNQARAPVNMRMLPQPNPWASFFARGLQRATLQEPVLGKPTEVLRRFKRIHIAL